MKRRHLVILVVPVMACMQAALPPVTVEMAVAPSIGYLDDVSPILERRVAHAEAGPRRIPCNFPCGAPFRLCCTPASTNVSREDNAGV